MGQPAVPEPCATCRHFLGLHIEEQATDQMEALMTVNCTAFPNGIPEDIQDGKHRHRQAHDGDRGIKFEEEL